MYQFVGNVLPARGMLKSKVNDNLQKYQDVPSEMRKMRNMKHGRHGTL